VRREGRPAEADLVVGDGLDKLEFDARVSPVHEADGSSGGVVLALRDVTRLRRLEAVRRDFVANVSHELKTPLTSVIAAVETLQNGALDDREAAETFLEKIGRNARNLSRIVTDLLELSRIEAGGVKFAEEPTDVGDCVAEALAATSERAKEKGVSLSVVEPKAPVFVRGDPDLLTRALVNLLENAIAYTDKGGRVSATTEVKDGRVETSIADTGIGIPRAELERVFERFYRVDRARSRASGGTGLGLAIVRHVAERHGGSVRVVSEEGRGSVFTLSLPIVAGGGDALRGAP
jgi:two-component system, OmpR family, phosphate regulon sensor histidine kinase PhoR